MPRNIKNDQPSISQLNDIVRGIVKSEIRRRDGALAGSLAIAPVPGGILTYNGSSQLTTQYITTSGAVGSVVVTITADVNLFLNSTTGDIRLNAGANLNTIATTAHFVSRTMTLGYNVGNAGDVFTIQDEGGAVQASITLGGGVATISADGAVNILGDSFFGSFTTMQGNAVNDITWTSGTDQVFSAGGNIQIIGGAQFLCNTTTDYVMTTGNNISLNFNNASSGSVCEILDAGGSSLFRITTTDALLSVTGNITLTMTGFGAFGGTPVAQSTGYTVGTVPAVSKALTLATATTAYTAVPLALLNAATIVDLNALRVDVVRIAAVLRQLIKDNGSTSGYNWLGESGY